jgi:hypothetical protein
VRSINRILENVAATLEWQSTDVVTANLNEIEGDEGGRRAQHGGIGLAE